MSEAQTTSETPAAPPPSQAPTTPPPSDVGGAAGTVLTNTPGETKPADTKPGEAKPGEAPKAPDAPPAPLELKLPDGYAPNAFDKFKTEAQSIGLKSEQAQKMVDMYVERQQEAVKQQQERVATQLKEWADAARTDKEYGGEKFSTSLTVAQKAIQRFGGDSLKSLLDETGLGNHPELVRFCVRVGQALGEDSVAGSSGAGAGSGNSEADVLRQMYPTMHKDS